MNKKIDDLKKSQKFKIYILGNSTVGKTSFILRFTENFIMNHISKLQELICKQNI